MPKIVSKVNLITLTILTKRLILDAWLGSGRNSADWYIKVLKIQTKMCKDGRQVKMESFWSTVSIWSLCHNLTIKTTIKRLRPVPLLKNICSEHFLQIIIKLSVAQCIYNKISCFQYILLNNFRWVWIMKIGSSAAFYFRP